MNKKYYTTKFKNKAITISFLIGEDFMTFQDKRGGKIYSFKNTDKLRSMIKLIEKIKY